MTRGRFLIPAMVAAATLATLTIPVARFAIWNRTASVPTGLYLIHRKTGLHVGERVAIAPPQKLRRLLAERHYLPANIPSSSVSRAPATVWVARCLPGLAVTSCAPASSS